MIVKHEFPAAIKVILPIANSFTGFLPVIFVADKNDAALNEEVLLWARYMVNGYSITAIDARIGSLTKFINFFHLWASDLNEISIEEQTEAILIFTYFRINGTKTLAEDHILKPLNWAPVSQTTSRIDFNYVTDFFIFVEQNLGQEIRSLSKEVLRFPIDFNRKMEIVRGSRQNEFLAHLAKSIRFWDSMREDTQFKVPKWARPSSNKAIFRAFPTLEEIEEIIGAERNPTFKALWIAGSFGSHRISEQLNVWQCDILPASYRKHFFDKNVGDTILYLMAHPISSTYTEDFTKNKGPTREYYLKERYNLIPRPNYSPTDNRRAGWKAKSLYGRFETTATFWLDSSAAKLFQICIEEIQNFHAHNRTSRKHPYFFVNMFSKDASYGEPLQMKRVQSAWEQACKRVGITPYRNGRNIHKLRHFSKWFAENHVGLNSREIQIIRGDTSVNSQDQYGKDLITTHKFLSNYYTESAKLNELF